MNAGRRREALTLNEMFITAALTVAFRDTWWKY